MSEPHIAGSLQERLAMIEPFEFVRSDPWMLMFKKRLAPDISGGLNA